MAVLIVVLLATVVMCAVLTGIGVGAPITGSLTLGMLTLVARAGNALKRQLPPTLLMPIPTPLGDLGVAVAIVAVTVIRWLRRG